jgi:predicted translin family RNA/ssDNA-binding protein
MSVTENFVPVLSTSTVSHMDQHDIETVSSYMNEMKKDIKTLKTEVDELNKKLNKYDIDKKFSECYSSVIYNVLIIILFLKCYNVI